MKLFMTIKRNYHVLGINSKQSIQAHPFNKRIVLGSITICLNIISHGVFLSEVANSFMEYTKSIYMFSAAVLVAINFENMVFKMTKLLKIFAHLDEHVNKSE